MTAEKRAAAEDPAQAGDRPRGAGTTPAPQSADHAAWYADSRAGAWHPRKSAAATNAERVSRRGFIKFAGAALAATAVDAADAAATPAAQAGNPVRPGTEAPAPATWLFFSPEDARLIEAMVERLIPADENGPGARDAGVARYLDLQLAGAWGAGARLYRAGPWRSGTPGQGYQLPFTPAELFRTALRALRADLARRGGTPFERLDGAAQDNYLKLLEAGNVNLGEVPSKVFFESLLELTIEGFFSDPVYGGNRDMVAWRMIGFPGAYASFYDLVDQHGVAYTRRPMSLGEDARGVIHLHRDNAGAGMGGAGGAAGAAGAATGAAAAAGMGGMGGNDHGRSH